MERMGKSHHKARILLRYILSFVFSSLFVAFIFVFGPSLGDKPIFGIFALKGFTWSSYGIFYQFFIVMLLILFAQVLASLITLTLPNMINLLLNVVFGSLVVEIVVSFLPYFHIDLVTPATFGVFYLGIISPVLLFLQFLFYLISRPYQKRMTVSYH